MLTQLRRPVALLYVALSGALLWVVQDYVVWQPIGGFYGWRDAVGLGIVCAVVWRCLRSALGKTALASAALPAAVAVALLFDRVRTVLTLEQVLIYSQRLVLVDEYAPGYPPWWHDAALLGAACAAGAFVGWLTERRWT